METAAIRRRFLDFFSRHEHTEVAFTSLLYHAPTLL